MASIIQNNFNREDILDLVQSVIPVTASFQATEFKVFVGMAEENFIFPYINEPMYSAIIATPENFPRVYDNIKTAVLNAAMELFSPVLEVTIGANGYTDESTSKSKAASLEKARNIRRHFKNMANISLENALKLMEADTDNKYQLWKDSPLFTVFNNTIIKTTDEFITYSGIRINRRVFLLLKQTMIRAEYQVKNILGKIFFDALITEIDNDDYQFLNDTFVKPIIAKMAFHASIPNLTIAFGEEDLISLFDNSSSEMILKYKSSTPDMLNFQIEKIAKEINTLISEMNNFLADNAELFSEYSQTVVQPILPKDLGKITRL